MKYYCGGTFVCLAVRSREYTIKSGIGRKTNDHTGWSPPMTSPMRTTMETTTLMIVQACSRPPFPWKDHRGPRQNVTMMILLTPIWFDGSSEASQSFDARVGRQTEKSALPRSCSGATIWPFAPCDSDCLATLSNSKRGNFCPTSAPGGRTVLQ